LQEWAFAPDSTLILALDHIWDPGNLGAIFRNAVCGGVSGLLINADRSSPLNETVLTRSAGTLLKANYTICNNLVNEIKLLKKNGFWVVGACGDAEKTVYDWDFTLPTVLVLGNEQRGISGPVRKQLDMTLSIPMKNDSESLNVASASAVFIFEALRQKNILGQKKRGS
jgi:tRNA G18 (ribose-2'-O)-methylase SpoU